MERLTVLGSSNAVAKRNQENAYLLVESGNRKIMIDCGDHPAAGLARAGVKENQVTDIILTHFHADHVGSLPLIIMDMWLEKRESSLMIYGLSHTVERAKKLLDLYDWQNWSGLFPVSFITLADEGMENFLVDQNLLISALPVKHLIPTIGLRVELTEGKKYCYTCDSEPCENILKLADGVDVLLHESAGESKGHSSARQAGEEATKAGVGSLVLIHYEARTGSQVLLSEAQSTFSGKVDLAFDGMIL